MLSVCLHQGIKKHFIRYENVKIIDKCTYLIIHFMIIHYIIKTFICKYKTDYVTIND